MGGTESEQFLVRVDVGGRPQVVRVTGSTLDRVLREREEYQARRALHPESELVVVTDDETGRPVAHFAAAVRSHSDSIRIHTGRGPTMLVDPYATPEGSVGIAAAYNSGWRTHEADGSVTEHDHTRYFDEDIDVIEGANLGTQEQLPLYDGLRLPEYSAPADTTPQ